MMGVANYCLLLLSLIITLFMSHAHYFNEPHPVTLQIAVATNNVCIMLQSILILLKRINKMVMYLYAAV